MEHEFGTQQSIYGLQTGEEYEVRVHCAMRAFNNFGEFSDVIFVHVPEIPNEGERSESGWGQAGSGRAGWVGQGRLGSGRAW